MKDLTFEKYVIIEFDCGSTVSYHNCDKGLRETTNNHNGDLLFYDFTIDKWFYFEHINDNKEYICIDFFTGFKVVTEEL